MKNTFNLVYGQFAIIITIKEIQYETLRNNWVSKSEAFQYDVFFNLEIRTIITVILCVFI